MREVQGVWAIKVESETESFFYYSDDDLLVINLFIFL